MRINIKTFCVYKITNTLNNKFYIGYTGSLLTRINIHVYKLKKHEHTSKSMQEDFDLYGDIFEVDVVEWFENENTAYEYEQNLIIKLHPDYNVDLKEKNYGFLRQAQQKLTNQKLTTHEHRGSGNPNATLTELQVKEIRTNYTGKRGEQKELAEKYKISAGAIASILSGRSWGWLS